MSQTLLRRVRVRSCLAWMCLLFAGGGQAASSASGDGLERLPNDTRPLHYLISARPNKDNTGFAAKATLRFEVVTPTAQVVVNSRDLTISKAQLKNGASPKVSTDLARHRTLFSFDKPLARGQYELEVEYTGLITENIEGVFRVDQQSRDGRRQQMLFTHLCCIGTARKFAPLWDQPDLKAVFELELTIPAGLDAVSNTPIAKRESLPSGESKVRFEPSPKMSSYLLFFAVGKFDRVVSKAGSTEVGVYTQPGKGEQGRFALQATVDSLNLYNDYFGVDYPLKKLDSIAFPGAGGFGAMENWGAIFYFEPYLLIDPKLATQRNRQDVYVVVAHEVSHQWFGNLVTMKWWDDLWLNEGFATWMASKATDHYKPEWNVWRMDAESREQAMRLDARDSTHPIIRPVRTYEEAELSFDEITYEKGNQVIRMIEAYVGEDAFKKAIRAHVKKHAYDNAVTDDLWRELEITSPFPVSDIARDFTVQEGVPLIDVISSKCVGDKTTLSVRQGRFGLDAKSKQAKEWRVPVTATVVGTSKVARQVVRGSAPANITLEGCGPVKVNLGEAGYYRTRYDSASFAQLDKGFGKLPAQDQLGLMNDSFNLAEGGYTPFAGYLDLVLKVPVSADPVLWLHLTRAMGVLDKVYEGRPDHESFRAFARWKASGALRQLGWVERADESANASIARAELVELLASLGDSATQKEALRRFHGADKDPSLISGGMRQAIVNAVGMSADAKTLDELLARAANSTDSAESQMYLLAAARVQDPALANRVLDLTLTDAIPAPLVGNILRQVAESHPVPTFDFVTSKYAAVGARLESFARVGVAQGVASNAVDVTVLPRLEKFVTEKVGDAGRESLNRTRSMVTFRDEVRRERLPEVDTWLRAHASAWKVQQ
ncbi:MAG TPA: M1 family metallopeptidase [Steroidobacter sp.]